MQIQFQVNFESLIALQQNVIEHAETHRVKQGYFKWVSTIIMFFALLFIIGPSLLIASISLIISLGYFAFFPYLYKKVAFSRLSKKMKVNDYSHLLGEHKVTLSDDGIKRDITGESTKFSWDDFENFQEDDQHYFLYVTDLQGLIISKNPNDMNETDTLNYRRFLEDKMTHQIKQHKST